jgi:hemoglobin
MRAKFVITLLALLLCTSGAPVRSEDGTAAGASSATPGASLYARIGGKEVVERVVSEMVDSVVADPRLNPPFRKVNLARLKRRLALFFCSKTGGGCEWDGDPVQVVHAGLNIDEAQMYGLVEALRDAMVHAGVPLRERNELLALLAPFKRDVVTH